MEPSNATALGRLPPTVRIEPLGPEALPLGESLWFFHEIAEEIQQGKSLRKACRSFKVRKENGTFPRQLDCELRVAHECCKTMKWFFGRRFGIPDGAVLFNCRGKGFPFVGLTEQGSKAWELARDFLMRLGTI